MLFRSVGPPNWSGTCPRARSAVAADRDAFDLAVDPLEQSLEDFARADFEELLDPVGEHRRPGRTRVGHAEQHEVRPRGPVVHAERPEPGLDAAALDASFGLA